MTTQIPYCWHCIWIGEDGERTWDQYEDEHPATRHWDNFPDKIIPLYNKTQDQSDRTATLEEQMDKQKIYINRLHKLCNANGLGIGRNLLTGEVIPFEVEE